MTVIRKLLLATASVLACGIGGAALSFFVDAVMLRVRRQRFASLHQRCAAGRKSSFTPSGFIT